jgi:hypothetical protein
MQTGTVKLVPAKEAVADSELRHHHRTLISFMTVNHMQTQPLNYWIDGTLGIGPCKNCAEQFGARGIELVPRLSGRKQRQRLGLRYLWVGDRAQWFRAMDFKNLE